MDKYGTNGHDLELAQYETPFADTAIAREDSRQQVSNEDFFTSYQQEIDSPFSRTFEVSPSQTSLTQAGEEYVNFLAELNDSEFENTLYELAAEAEDTWSSKITSEVAMGTNYVPFVTRQSREFFEPLAQETEAMIDKVSEYFSGNNLGDHSDQEIEAFFNELPFNHSQFSPAQEQFFGGIFNKIRSVVGKGIDLAKKGIAAVGKFLPINIILNKIKGLIRPLLDKVLQFAIGKLPKNLQPYAQTLAKKFLNLESSEEAEAGYSNNESELSAIQTELDNHIAQLVFAPDQNEAENLVSDYETSFETVERNNNYETGGFNVPSLNEARDQFINELRELAPGQSAAPAIERFLPAVIMALQPVIKIALSIIGRQKVVNFLADLLAKLVSKYVPSNVAQPLAASIIDVGLSAMGFETYEQQRPDLGYEAIANTIQETIQNMNGLNENMINDQEALTLSLLEAFETAAADNFPSQYIKEQVRTSKQNGLWVLMPRTGPGHYYKKFTHVFNITIDPQTAATVTTFRGLPLANFLRDKLGLDPSKPIQAKVHLYEAVKDTRLSRISKFEKLPGFNASQPFAWIQLQPLTHQAASLLLKEPVMGRMITGKQVANRYRISPGERFYFLEINGAHLRVPQIHHFRHKHHLNGAPVTARPSQSGDIQGVINFTKSEIVINYYFSEEDAKQVVEKLNRNDFLGAAQTVRNAVKNVLNDILINNVASKVKIIHEAVPELYLEHFPETEQFDASSIIGKFGGKELISSIVGKMIEKIADLAYQSLGNYFKARAAEFKEAQAKPQDGVTIKILFRNIQGMSSIRAVINAIRGNFSINDLSGLKLPNIPAPEIQIVADKVFD